MASCQSDHRASPGRVRPWYASRCPWLRGCGTIRICFDALLVRGPRDRRIAVAIRNHGLFVTMPPTHDLSIPVWFTDAEIDELLDWFFAQLRDVGATDDTIRRAPGAFATIVETCEYRKRRFTAAQCRLLHFVRNPNRRF